MEVNNKLLNVPKITGKEYKKVKIEGRGFFMQTRISFTRERKIGRKALVIEIFYLFFAVKSNQVTDL